MRRIPVSLGQILRRYAFSYTQLLCRIVAHEVHGALRAPPDEADLGPARFWAGVHRRERCGPESDGGQLARRLVVRCAGGQPAPARCFRVRARGGSRLRLQGQLSRRAAAEAALPAAQDRDREPAKPTKKHCNGFTRHLSLDLADPRVDGRLVSSEAWAVPPDPCDWDSSAAVAAAAPRGCPI